jgi:hypothetical protein
MIPKRGRRSDQKAASRSSRLSTGYRNRLHLTTHEATRRRSKLQGPGRDAFPQSRRR